MSIAAQNQAASWRIRRRNRSAQFTVQATPWASGLVVSEGDICQSNGLAFAALNSGTTGAGPAPNNEGRAVLFDGAVYWQHQWLLLVAPTPIT